MEFFFINFFFNLISINSNDRGASDFSRKSLFVIIFIQYHDWIRLIRFFILNNSFARGLPNFS